MLQLRLLVANTAYEALDRLEVRLSGAPASRSRQSRHRLVARARDQARHPCASSARVPPRLRTRRRHANRAEHMADVGLVEHALPPRRRPRAPQARTNPPAPRTRHLPTGPPGHRLRRSARSPALLEAECSGRRRHRSSPRVVGRPGDARASCCRMRAIVLGMRSREQAAQRPAVRERDDHRALASPRRAPPVGRPRAPRWSAGGSRAGDPDRPVPRLSKQISRPRAASRPLNSAMIERPRCSSWATNAPIRSRSTPPPRPSTSDRRYGRRRSWRSGCRRRPS